MNRQWIILSENRQLQLLHKRIVDVNQEYLQREREWSAVKYKLMQMANIFAFEPTGGSRSIVASGDNKKQKLKLVIKIEDSHNSQVNQQFRTLFQHQYLDNVLLMELNPNISNQLHQIAPISLRQHQQQQHDAMSLPLLRSNIMNKSQEEIELQLVSQKHRNQLLQKEIQLLEKQYDCVDNHVKAKQNEKNNMIKKQQHQNKQSQQQHNQQYKQQNMTHQEEIKIDDEYYLSQISCVRKLINNKLSLINELKQTNSLVKKKIAQLKAKQCYLEKRKVMMEAKHHELEKKRAQFMDEYTKDNLKYQSINEKHTISVQSNNTTTNTQAIQQANQINQLITRQLTHQLIQQKLLLVQQKQK